MYGFVCVCACVCEERGRRRKEGVDLEKMNPSMEERSEERKIKRKA